MGTFKFMVCTCERVGGGGGSGEGGGAQKGTHIDDDQLALTDGVGVRVGLYDDEGVYLQHECTKPFVSRHNTTCQTSRKRIHACMPWAGRGRRYNGKDTGAVRSAKGCV